MRFAKFFGTTARFWLDLQDDYVLEEGSNKKSNEIDEIKTIDHDAA